MKKHWRVFLLCLYPALAVGIPDTNSLNASWENWPRRIVTSCDLWVCRLPDAADQQRYINKFKSSYMVIHVHQQVSSLDSWNWADVYDVRSVQVKLWDPLRTRAIPERLVFTTRRYTNPRLPYPTRWRWQYGRRKLLANDVIAWKDPSLK